MGRKRKEILIKFEPLKRGKGRPPKAKGDLHRTYLCISGSLEEISQIRINASASGKSISRYIIESLV